MKVIAGIFSKFLDILFQSTVNGGKIQMKRIKKNKFSQFYIENKLALLNDHAALQQIEKRLEEKWTKAAERKTFQEGQLPI
ncbi:FbpB family small basic protein [Bacillus chungangensis]|uniref:Uncharacterized protein n=1 Tax=Bacillus chungangensis TaxID=587633 RepID=A0ABT9WSZ5_9BACI|nr:FbpB family small basic protein [Bacillus chungangensis]MDQ0176423.1 hypothetical protein [Bacillus chungangensis]